MIPQRVQLVIPVVAKAARNCCATYIGAEWSNRDRIGAIVCNQVPTQIGVATFSCSSRALLVADVTNLGRLYRDRPRHRSKDDPAIILTSGVAFVVLVSYAVVAGFRTTVRSDFA